MIKSLLGIFLLLAGSAPIGAAAADGCETIEDVGEKWHKVADYIEKHSDNGKLLKAEAAKVRSTVRDISPLSSELARELIALEFGHAVEGWPG